LARTSENTLPTHTLVEPPSPRLDISFERLAKLIEGCAGILECAVDAYVATSLAVMDSKGSLGPLLEKAYNSDSGVLF
jgi:hypothetical protein